MDVAILQKAPFVCAEFAAQRLTATFTQPARLVTQPSQPLAKLA